MESIIHAEKKLQMEEQNKIKEQLEKKKVLENEYHDILNNGLYNTIRMIPNKQKMLYIFILFSSYFFLQDKIGIYPSLFVGITFIYFLYSQNKIYTYTYTKELEIKELSLVPRPKYFYIAPEFIEIFYQLHDHRISNNKAYTDALVTCDLFLKVYNDVLHNNVSHCDRECETAKLLMKNTLNYIHSFIHSSQFIQLDHKLNDALKKIQLAMYRRYNDMVKHCNEYYQSHEWNINSNYIIPNELQLTPYDETQNIEFFI
jgi:hypothetical protein